jgi:hypothetical protein
LTTNAAFSQVGVYPKEWVASAGTSREVAYNLMAKLLAQDLGADYRTHIQFFVDLLLSYIDQWCVSKTTPYIQPFMVGLTAEALILYHSKSGDPRVLPAIRTAMDYLWERTWVPTEESFLYADRAAAEVGGPGAVVPAPDLNLLIAPAFAWLYAQTGEAKYLERGDQIFAGGVRRAAVDWGPKQYNQSYRWSFDYVKWRSQGPAPPNSAGIGAKPSSPSLALPSSTAPPPAASAPPPTPSSSLANAPRETARSSLPTDLTQIPSQDDSVPAPTLNFRSKHGPLGKRRR